MIIYVVKENMGSPTKQNYNKIVGIYLTMVDAFTAIRQNHHKMEAKHRRRRDFITQVMQTSDEIN